MTVPCDESVISVDNIPLNRCPALNHWTCPAPHPPAKITTVKTKKNCEAPAANPAHARRNTRLRSFSTPTICGPYRTRQFASPRFFLMEKSLLCSVCRPPLTTPTEPLDYTTLSLQQPDPPLLSHYRLDLHASLCSRAISLQSRLLLLSTRRRSQHLLHAES